MKRFKTFIKEDQYLNNQGDKFIWNPSDISTDSSSVTEAIFESDEEWMGTANASHGTFYGDSSQKREAMNQWVANAKKIHTPNKLDANEEHAMFSYTGSGYRSINKYHRTGEQYDEDHKHHQPLKNILDQTKDLDSAIDKHPTEHNAHVWRGIYKTRNQPSHFSKMKKGDTFHDKGYVSTSFNPQVAQTFNGEHGHIVHIKVPKGSKALHPLSHDGYPSKMENELILPRNSRFRYEGKTKHFDGTIIHHLSHIPGDDNEKI